MGDSSLLNRGHHMEENPQLFSFNQKHSYGVDMQLQNNGLPSDPVYVLLHWCPCAAYN